MVFIFLKKKGLPPILYFNSISVIKLILQRFFFVVINTIAINFQVYYT